MTPYELEILLHYHACHSSFPRSDALIFQQTVGDLVRSGLMNSLNPTWDRFELTEMGHFYVVEGLCKVPLPVAKWEIPAREKEDQ